MAIKTIKVDVPFPHRKELIAAAAITPGFLCERTSAGKVQAHSTAGGTAAPIFALEDDVQGNGIATAYSADNAVQLLLTGSGDVVYARLADGENASDGDYLESNGDGYLRVVDADASVGDIVVRSVVGQAQEAVDMSGSSGEDPTGLIKVMIV